MNMMENIFKKVHNPWHKTFMGCIILSALVFLFPPLYGEGYESIEGLLSGDPSSIVNRSIFYHEGTMVWFIILFIALIVLTKAFATSATNGGGGVGRHIRAIALRRMPFRIPLLHIQSTISVLA